MTPVEQQEKRAIIVAGMHRSGTSSLVRVLNLLGCDVPANLLEANAANRKGYWESPHIIRLNEDILNSVDMDWRSLKPFDQKWYECPAYNEYSERGLALLQSEFGSSSLFVLKDPRICRLTRFWSQTLANFGATPLVVCPIRNPLEVAASLAARNSIRPASSQLMWLRYVLDAEFATRGMPRVFVSYGHLVSDWRTVIGRISNGLGINWPKDTSDAAVEIEEFLSPSLRHHVERSESIIGNPEISPWLSTTFATMDGWSIKRERTSDFKKLDAVRAGFDNALPELFELHVQGRKSEKAVRSLNKQLKLRSKELQTEKDITRQLTKELKTEKANARSLTNHLGKVHVQLAETSDKLQWAGAKFHNLGKRFNSGYRLRLARAWKQYKILFKTLRRSKASLRMRVRALKALYSTPRRQIISSGYFDHDWYLAENPDVSASGMDAAGHYLFYGGEEGRNPGPKFSSQLYREKSAGAAGSGMNPLIHYVKYGKYVKFGKSDRREIFPCSLPEETSVTGETAVPPPEPLSFSMPNPVELPWARLSSLQPVTGCRGIQLSGEFLGTIPAEDAGQESTWQTIAKPLLALEFFSHLMGYDPAQEPRVLVGRGKKRASGFTHEQLETARCPILCAPIMETGFEFVDIWFVNDRDMRVRLECRSLVAGTGIAVRFFQQNLANDGRLDLAGEALLNGQGPIFVDLELANGFCPVLMTFSSPAGQLLSASILPFPSICRGGAHYSELAANADGISYVDQIKNVSENFLHKLVGFGESDEKFTVARVSVNLCNATGAERVFSTDITEWLTTVMQIRLVGKQSTSSADKRINDFLKHRLQPPELTLRSRVKKRISTRELHGLAEIVIPVSSIPSLNALVARGADAAPGPSETVGSFVMADAVTQLPKQSVHVASAGASLMALQPSYGGANFPVLRRLSSQPSNYEQNDQFGVPLAVLFTESVKPNAAQLLLPCNPEMQPLATGHDLSAGSKQAKSISVLVANCGSYPEALSSFLESLWLQTVSESIEIVAVSGTSPSIERSKAKRSLQHLFPRKYSFDEVHASLEFNEQINLLANRAAGEFLLVADERTILHDPRTLETLLVLADHDNVASAGCILVTDDKDTNANKVSFLSGGIFPVPDNPSEGAQFRFCELDCYETFPLATYQVAGNSSKLFMARTDNWKALGGFDAASPGGLNGDVDYGLRAIQQNLIHYCTSVVSAGFHGHKAQTPADGNTELLQNLNDDDWQAISRSACIIRSIAS